MIYIYNLIFYQPILNALVFFYETVAVRDFGIAIILTTLLLRLILAPFFHKGAHQQAVMQRIQPKIKKIQETHKGDKEKQTRALMELYKEHGVNPFSSILLLIIQIPILIAVYGIIKSGIGPNELSHLYSFVSKPTLITHSFLGILDLESKSFILVFLAAIAQYVQARLTIIHKDPNGGPLSPAEKMARQMTFIGPLVTVFIFYNLPAAVGLYWLVSSIFSIFQQLIVNRSVQKKFSS
jgi:YidC/Oxa1 family membrane protein insertase